jgi:hypothetical protein
LTPTVNILSGEVKAKTAGDTDKGGVIARRLAGRDRGPCRGDPPGGRPATRAGFGSSLDPAAAGNNQGATMNDIARQLRAQIPASTDPDRLERMAREIESGMLPQRRPGQAHQGLTPANESLEVGGSGE